jgi:hypothetical protein
MPQTLCGCSKKLVDPEDANYVLRGIGYCFLTCMRQAEARYLARQRALQAQAARDVPPGQSWAFTDHRSQADVGDD